MRAVLPLQRAFARIKNPMPIGIVYDVIEISDFLLLHEIAQDVHIAVRLRIGGKNIVVGNNDDFVLVPDLRALSEFALEHADRSGSANVVGHENVRFDPNIISSPNPALARGASQYFFSQCHSAISAETNY